MTKSTSKVKTFNILIAVTGSVAAIKIIELIRKLRSAFPRSYTSIVDDQTYKATIAIKVVMTENSKHFVPKDELLKNCTSSSCPYLDILDDADEWNQWTRIGDPVLHIELRKWADLCLIAPLDANTLAKIASGICDNLLTCTVRAWDVSKPLIYCPAMNVHMYNHPVTSEHLEKLESFGYQRIDCIEKRLACGDFGLGAMATVDTIVDRLVESLLSQVSRSGTSARDQLSASRDQLPPATDQNSVESFERLKTRAKFNANSRNYNLRSSNASLADASPSIMANATNGGSSLLLRPSQSFSTNENGRPPKDEYHDDEGSIEQIVPGSKLSNIVTSLKNLRAINKEPEAQMGIDSEKFDEIDNGDHIANNYSNQKLPNALVQNLMANGLLGSSSSSSSAAYREHNKTSASNFNNKSIIMHNLRQASSKLKGTVTDPSALLSQCINRSRNCFTCVICKNDYKNRKSMSRHLKEQHLQGNIHRCSPCGVSYKRREKLIKHNREHHGIDGL